MSSALTFNDEIVVVSKELAEEITLISFEELQQEVLALKDLIISDKATDDDMLQTQEIILGDITAEDLINIAPPGADNGAQRQGFTQAKTVVQNPLALHYAAKKGDLKEIRKLVEQQGYDVNGEDTLSSRPLYVASLYGHKEAVKYFLEKGADVHDFSYELDTALHAAIQKQQYQVARLLVEEGGANIDLINLEQDTPTNMLITQYDAIIQKGSNELRKPENIKIMSEIIDTLAVFFKYSGDHFVYTVQVGNDLSYDVPVNFFLRSFASRAPTNELQNKILKLADEIASFDPSEEMFENAKNLLNTFPNKNVYTISFGDDHKSVFDGKGHVGCITTKFACKSIQAFNDVLKQSCTDQQKLKAFAKLATTFEAATELKSNGEIEAYSQKAHQRYESGETVLLGSGWSSHFIDVVLSKTQELFITGNSGNRCHQISPGLNFYHMNNTDTIKPAFMHDMTVNPDKSKFERDIMYDYELIEKVGEKVTPLQLYPNCTWVGHQHGIEACLYVELLNQGVKKEVAGPLASKYYTEWEQFHAKFQIDTYMKGPQCLPAKALVDIFIDVVGKTTKENAAHQKELATKICQALTSDHYKSEFKTWYDSASYANKKLFAPYHVTEKFADLPSHKSESGGGFFGLFKKALGAVDTQSSKATKTFQQEASHGEDHAATHSQGTDAPHQPVQVTHEPLVHLEQHAPTIVL
ncbi:MAG: ankyrin repeat domain-containing protein [Proteobacteria bacterium]|nr:ankyrin repeat domain-containing protein [Pseudomonadota bacterium]